MKYLRALCHSRISRSRARSFSQHVRTVLFNQYRVLYAWVQLVAAFMCLATASNLCGHGLQRTPILLYPLWLCIRIS